MLLAYTFGWGLATITLAAFLFVWFHVAIRIVRRDDLSVLYFIWDAARPRTT